MTDETNDPSRFTPGTHGCHEALHIASVLMEMVDERLRQHPAVLLKPEWRNKAEAARDLLMELYQDIGREHC